MSRTITRSMKGLTLVAITAAEHHTLLHRFMLLYVHSSIAIILMGKRELIALLNLSSWCLVMVERLFLAVPWGCLQFVIVVFPDHTHLLFFMSKALKHETLVKVTVSHCIP